MQTSADLLAKIRELHGRVIDLSLDRMQRLLASLGHPEERFPPVVHVAGTNGKGSVIALLQAFLEASGRRVHVLTSPPLRSFRECVRLAGKDAGRSAPISEERFFEALSRVVAANEGRKLTSFEAETAAAFLAFAEVPADIVLLETGMGGRLDATNVVARPLQTIITPIGLDHMDFLGRTLDKIAAEKAGILKRGVPCVVGRQEEMALDTIEAAAIALGVPLYVFGRDWEAFEQHGRLVYQDDQGVTDLPLPALVGRHQIENAGLAIAAASRLGALLPGEAAIETGLQSVTWPARLQRLGTRGLTRLLPKGSEIWLDGGHNASAAVALAQSMAELEERASKPLVLVVGMLRSKHPLAFLSPFRGLAQEVLTVPIPDTSRAYAKAFQPEEIAAIAAGLDIPSRACESIEDALQAIRKLDDAPSRILICGSFHLAGSVLEAEDKATSTAARA